MIKIWKFEKAPMEYRLLYPSGQDVNWIAHVPAGEDAKDFAALVTSATGVVSMERCMLADGSFLYFGRLLEIELNQDERDTALPTAQHDR